MKAADIYAGDVEDDGVTFFLPCFRSDFDANNPLQLKYLKLLLFLVLDFLIGLGEV
jgi:hypothetical protein